MKRNTQVTPFAAQHRHALREESRIQGARWNASAAGQLYRTPAWRRLRARVLQHWKTCAACGADATVVDHIIPHKGDRRLFHDPRNLMPMCKPCHDRKTARYDGGFGRTPVLAPPLARPTPTPAPASDTDDGYSYSMA
jgi:5-methylcytosine-specific restriction protein A